MALPQDDSDMKTTQADSSGSENKELDVQIPVHNSRSPTPTPETERRRSRTITQQSFDESHTETKENHSPSQKPMRPARDVLDRIQWDASCCDSKDILVGYEDRHDGIKEVAFENWTKETTDEEFIPQHRIRYIMRKSDRYMLWNRHLRIDEVFHSG